MFQIIETYGDIFAQCPPHIPLVHCVSLDLKMSKGIASVFKRKFGNVPFLKAQVHSVGQVATLNFEGRFIFYMATKRHFFGKPTVNIQGYLSFIFILTWVARTHVTWVGFGAGRPISDHSFRAHPTRELREMMLLVA